LPRAWYRWNGKLFVATPPESGQGLWQVQKLEIATSEDGEVGAYVLSLGQDAGGELYVLTSRRPGPVGTTGRVYRLVPAPEQEASLNVDLGHTGVAASLEERQ
jgi:hypothetical protein